MRSLLSIFLLFSVSANAATLYCGPSSTGSGSGADFNNRMALPNGTGFTRGNTYVVVEGSYGSKTLSTAASGTTQITIRLATTADSGVAGYATSLYDGQAVFGSITVATKYWVMNGTRRDESNGWAAPSGYGFAASSIGSDSSGGEDGSYSEFYYMDLGATYEANPSSGTIGGYGPIARFVYSATGIKLSRCALHNGSGALLLIPGSQNFIVEYCNFGPGWGKEAISCMNSSASGTTVRYCRFWDAALKDPTDGTTGTTAEIGMFDPYTTGVSYSNWKIYGNWFKSDRSTGRNAVIIIGGGGYPGTAANCLVYNNTIANMSEGGAYGMIVLVSGSGNEAKNNLFYNTPSSSVSANSTANNVTSSSNPFVGYSTQDYRIISTTGGTYPRNAGTALSSTYNQDPLGVTRGADGTWDVGAYEYDAGAGGDTTAPTVTAFTIPSTATSRTVAISTFTATDNTAVTGYLANESASTPSAGAAGWSGTAQTSYTFTTDGSKTLYAWAKDAAGNVSSSLNDSVLVDSTAPTLASATIGTSGNTITMTFDENVSLGSGGSGGWALTMSGGAVTLTYSSGSGSQSLVYSLSRVVGVGETVSSGLNYTQPGNGIEDALGNDAASISGHYVVNNSTADIVPPVVTITSPTNNQQTASASGSVVGTASDNVALASIAVTNLTTGVRVVTTGSTSWSGTATYISGTNYLQAIATDTSGLKSTGTVYIVYTVPPPVINRATTLRVTNWRQQ